MGGPWKRVRASAEPACGLSFRRCSSGSTYRVRQPRVLHLVPGLIAPQHCRRRIGIRAIVRGVVIPGGRVESTPLGNVDWCLEE